MKSVDLTPSRNVLMEAQRTIQASVNARTVYEVAEKLGVATKPPVKKNWKWRKRS